MIKIDKKYKGLVITLRERVWYDFIPFLHGKIKLKIYITNKQLSDYNKQCKMKKNDT